MNKTSLHNSTILKKKLLDEHFDYANKIARIPALSFCSILPHLFATSRLKAETKPLNTEVRFKTVLITQPSAESALLQIHTMDTHLHRHLHM